MFGDLDEDTKQILNDKIKACMEMDTLTFTVEDGKLVAIGHFGGGDDTIGHDNYSMIGWDQFIELS